MADKVVPGPLTEQIAPNEAVCIHTKKIYDSCRDKDCIEDLRVYLTASSQPYIDGALSIRPRSARLLDVDVRVDEIAFHRGYYTVDTKFFYQVTGEVFPAGACVTGLAIFDKRVILFGSEGSARVFSSCGDTPCTQPEAIVETVDPLALSMRIAEGCCTPAGEVPPQGIPTHIAAAFDSELQVRSISSNRVYVTLGQFSLIRLERDTQLIIPAYDYCLPDKECTFSDDDDPCSLFSKVHFPVEEFFPPDSLECPEEYKQLL